MNVLLLMKFQFFLFKLFCSPFFYVCLDNGGNHRRVDQSSRLSEVVRGRADFISVSFAQLFRYIPLRNLCNALTQNLQPSQTLRINRIIPHCRNIFHSSYTNAIPSSSFTQFFDFILRLKPNVIRHPN